MNQLHSVHTVLHSVQPVLQKQTSQRDLSDTGQHTNTQTMHLKVFRKCDNLQMLNLMITILIVFTLKKFVGMSDIQRLTGSGFLLRDGIGSGSDKNFG